MTRTEIAVLHRDFPHLAGKTVTVAGWVKTIRDSKALGFIELNDGSSFKNLQVVFEASKLENYKDVTRYNVGSAISVTGEVVLTPRGQAAL